MKKNEYKFSLADIYSELESITPFNKEQNYYIQRALIDLDRALDVAKRSFIEAKELNDILKDQEEIVEKKICEGEYLDFFGYYSIAELVDEGALTLKALEEVKRTILERDYSLFDNRTLEQHLNYIFRKKKKENN